VGSLTLPASGRVYIDTEILIYSVERHPMYGPMLDALWEQADNGTIELVTSELAVLEVLVLPIRLGDVALQQDYERLLTGGAIALFPVSRAVLRKAAELRAQLASLRTPDALHAATALDAAARQFVTNDSVFARLAALEVTILKDLIRQ
jgi:predicted nucleic acid-binding protein